MNNSSSDLAYDNYGIPFALAVIKAKLANAESFKFKHNTYQTAHYVDRVLRHLNNEILVLESNV